jgi:hypothetical protein
MSKISAYLIASTFIWISVLLQQSIIGQVTLFGASPDLVLAVCVPLCLLLDQKMSLWLGLFAGLMYGAAAGANLTHYIASYALSIFGLGYAKQIDVTLNSFTIFLLCASTILISKWILIFLAPPAVVFPYLGRSLGPSFYSGLLSIMLFPVFRLVFKAKVSL